MLELLEIKNKMKENERLVAIDPGTTKSAFVCIQGDEIIGKGIIPNREIFDHIYKEQPDYIVIEMIASYGMPVGKEVFETTVWIGRYIEAALSLDIKTYRVYRKDIKMSLCNSMRAKDSNIRAALIDKYGKPGTKANPNPFYNDYPDKMSKDIWAALAVGDYAIENFKNLKLEK